MTRGVLLPIPTVLSGGALVNQERLRNIAKMVPYVPCAPELGDAFGTCHLAHTIVGVELPRLIKLSGVEVCQEEWSENDSYSIGPEYWPFYCRLKGARAS